MCEKSVNSQTTATGRLNEAGRQLFAPYGEHDRSPVLAWLPILLGLLASTVVALAFCPVPRSQTVSGARALFLAIAYVGVTVGTGAFVLASCGTIAGQRRLKAPVWRILPSFGAVAAWMTPMVAFYMRDSWWAPWTASVLGLLGSRLIYVHHFAIGPRERPLSMAEPKVPHLSQATRLMWLTFAALLLHLAALSTAVSMVRPATLLIGSAVFVISLFQLAAIASNQSQSRYQKAVRSSTAVGLAIVFVGASLTPYLAVPGEDARSADTGTISKPSTAKPAVWSAKAKPGFLQSAGSLFRRFLADNPPPRAPGRPVDGASSSRPYPALQALFGKGETTIESQSNSLGKKSNKSKLTMLVADDSVHGLILRPKIEDHVTIVPPLPTRLLFEGKPSERSVDPVSIPFYGAYWFFKASEKTLPADAVEARGDPASASFKTTDFSPISMEARQNFGSLIDLSCCRAIELVISNGDRRPGTVVVELILTNTTLPGEPHQSLGISPVNSSRRWAPGDDRPPVTEVLIFRLPAQAAIPSFNETTIRFELLSPRERWSAMIAIEKFRLMPRGL